MSYQSQPLQYRPVDGEGQAAGLRDSLLTPLRFHEERSRRAEDTNYRNAQLQRETSRDVRNDERERVGQQQRAREMAMQDRRAGQREDLYALSENRRERVDQLNRQRLMQGEHEKLIQDLYNASNTGDPRAVQFAIDALSRAGYPVEEMQHTQAMPETAPQAAPAAPPAAPPAPKQHLSPQETKNVSAGLDAAEKRILPQLNGKGAPPKEPTAGRDAALSKQLDSADATYSAGLGIPSWLPGQSPVRNRAPTPDVAQSDAMLDPDDPYNKLVK